MNEIVYGDCLEEMAKMEANSISCIVTDPPYGLKFMGKDWDHGIPGVAFWKESIRVCKPGSHLLAFGGTRTYHRLTCAIEDAGWEIRDCLMWIFGSGFPKSHNHFGMEGYGTALKPAYEPIIMAMKPCDGTFKNNAEKWGQAGVNIDGCRIATDDRLSIGSSNMGYQGTNNPRCNEQNLNGRWPANVLFDEEAAKMLDEQSGQSKSKDGGNSGKNANPMSWEEENKDRPRRSPNDSGGASRFFYCAKASSSERNEGLDGFPAKERRPLGISNWEGQTNGSGEVMGKSSPQKNFHPTVKPLKLMEYLIKLVMPPKDGILLDPFAGSGTTILAAKRLGLNAIGIEKCEEYSRIARARIC